MPPLHFPSSLPKGTGFIPAHPTCYAPNFRPEQASIPTKQASNHHIWEITFSPVFYGKFLGRQVTFVSLQARVQIQIPAFILFLDLCLPCETFLVQRTCTVFLHFHKTQQKEQGCLFQWNLFSLRKESLYLISLWRRLSSHHFQASYQTIVLHLFFDPPIILD